MDYLCRLFRKIGAEEGATILYDEIDTVFGPKAKENEEIRGLLNAGHRRGAMAGRCVTRGKEVVTEDFPAYAAVALAGLGWLPDTLMTRSVIVRMRPRHAGEIVEPYRRRLHAPDGAKVFHAIEGWASSITEISWPELPDQITDRAADVWEPLIAVADAACGDWPARAREAAVTLVTAGQDVERSLGIRLLGDIRTIFNNEQSMSSKQIIAGLIEIEEAPWGDLKGKPLDERGLARHLRAYGIKSKVAWFGPKQARGYDRAEFEEEWKRYLPGASPGGSVTSVTGVTATDPKVDVTDVTDVAHSAGNGGDQISRRYVCRHCGKRGETLECSVGGDLVVRLHRGCIDRWMADYEDRSSGLGGATSLATSSG